MLTGFQIFVFGDDIEARTIPAGIEVSMPDDQGLRELLVQLRQHSPEGRLLLRRPRVRHLPMLIEASLITDADGVTVMPITVRTHLRHRPSQFDTPIPSDDEMIPNALPGPPMPILPCLMPLVNIGC